MRTLTASDALRFFLITGLGLAAYSCGGDTSPRSTGDGDSPGDGDAPGDGGSSGEIDLVIVPSTCTNPQPLIPGADTGFFSCDEGFIHRAEQRECPSLLPRSEELPATTSYGGAGSLDECTRDADCEGPLDYCVAVPSDADTYNMCIPSCVTDDDCEGGMICQCGEEFGTCTIAECEADADCGGDALCAGVRHGAACGGDFYWFACTPNDLTCYEDFCQFECQNGPYGISCSHNADCGRPFLVNSEIRSALAVRRDDWAAAQQCAHEQACAHKPQRADEEKCGASERDVVASYFERIALMEHASIAAFARFSLQLLSLGAPADLIERTNQALKDETKHARLAFSLARRFSKKPVGPGRLAIEGALADISPEAILTTTILEGCIGETKAALEAAAALEGCNDSEIRTFLAQVKQEEAEHAELAWKAVQWMLKTRPELRGCAQKTFEAALSAPRQVSTDLGAPDFGVLSGPHLMSVHADALERVVRPCEQRLFASHAGGAKEGERSVAGVAAVG